MEGILGGNDVLWFIEICVNNSVLRSEQLNAFKTVSRYVSQ